MKMKPWAWSRGFTVSLVVGTVLACGDIREDEFLCENAVSHLQQCCPGFRAAIDCSYVQGCDDTTYPELDSIQSECIFQASCADLRQRGVCELAAQLPDNGIGADAATPSVCTAPSAAFDAGASSGEDVFVVALVECASALDCPRGDVCCTAPTAAGPERVCGARPCTIAQACATDSECGPGKICDTFSSSSSNSTMLCVPATSMSDAAMTDAQSTAPDGTDARSESDADGSEGGSTSADGDTPSD